MFRDASGGSTTTHDVVSRQARFIEQYSPSSTVSSNASHASPCQVCGKGDCRLRTHRTFVQQSYGSRHTTSQPLYTQKPWVFPTSSFARSYAVGPVQSQDTGLTIDWIERCGLPSDDVDCQSLLRTGISKLLDMFLRHILPFQVIGPCQQWPFHTSRDILLSDELSCITGLSLWATLELAERPNPKTIWTACSLRNRTSHLLRQKMIQMDFGQHSTVMASSQIVVMAAFNGASGSELYSLSQGTLSLISTMGSVRNFVEAIPDESSATILQSFHASCIINMTEMDFKNDITRPAILASLQVAPYTPLDAGFSRACGVDVMAHLHDLQILLYYRVAGEQHVLCSYEERHCLIQLLLYVDVSQATLQARYVRTMSPSECIVLTSILVRAEVFSDHTVMGYLNTVILERLRSAMAELDIRAWLDADALVPLMWVAVIARSCSRSKDEQDFFAYCLIISLQHHFGCTAGKWPSHWKLEVANLMDRCLWHRRLDRDLMQICTEIDQTSPLPCYDDAGSR